MRGIDLDPSQRYSPGGAYSPHPRPLSPKGRGEKEYQEHPYPGPAMLTRLLLPALFVAASAVPASAADPFRKVSADVNQKMVKIFGSGGFKGVTNYTTGIIISPEGHLLSVASQTLDADGVIVHLYDGRRMKAKVIVTEPDLDVAMLKIVPDGKKIDEPTNLDLPYFDVLEAAKRPNAGAGD